MWAAGGRPGSPWWWTHPKREDGSFSVTGTITFPGEPTETFVEDRTAQTGNWMLMASGTETILTGIEAPPASSHLDRTH